MQLTKDQPGETPTLPELDDLPAPMLATAGDELDLESGKWQLELKWDGVRCVAAVNADGVRLMSRSGKDITARYPELDELRGALQAEAAILDGEIVALDENGRSDFSLLQPRMQASGAEVAKLRKQTPVTFMAFDLLRVTIDGQEHKLMRTAYQDRRALLSKAVEETPHVQVPPAFDGDLAAARDHVRRAGLEGVVAKRLGSHYTPGARSNNWIKIKDRRHQAVVVIGWRIDGDGGLRSLLVAVPDGEDLRYVGRVGSGIPARQVGEIQRTLERIERKTPATEVPSEDAKDARWVTPRLVGEVAYAELTRTKKLRQASWRGFRPDLDADDVTWEH